MEKESTSFWADIKKYEDNLTKDPNSYCFAPLSELYRKLGLLDDAVAVAKQGIATHPLYVGGFMALGRALYEKGSRDEAKAALEKVVLATPENLLAQRILSQIYQEEGNLPAAERALQLLVTFNPEDTESSIALEVLQKSMHVSADCNPLAAPSPDLVENSSKETSEVFCSAEEAHLSVPTQLEEVPESSDAENSLDQSWFADDSFSFAETPETETGILPLPTVTLAELYEVQGFLEKALDVYQDLLKKDPESHLLQERVTALSIRLAGESNLTLTESICAASDIEDTGLPQVTSTAELTEYDPGCICPNGQGADDKTLDVLGQWLEAIRRRKVCR
ncbi:MAG: tetratricopeptide repeat protein [Deltaproteobacteria bacterium]|nr:tetratricopeptide repeat protein [Deltaproteobacteria bacterium]TLN05130.1 MAG: tetratricopeptide repeat protein [bacterium]